MLRTTTPFGEGELWQRLASTSADRLTVVVDAVDLRRASLQVEQPLSWEHMYDHVVRAVGKSPLAAASRVVVTLGLSGAVIVRSSGESCLVFDPVLQESERERLGKGFVWGHQIVMLAALARHLVTGRDDDVRAALSGLHAMRTLHREGFEAQGEPGRERLKLPAADGPGRPARGAEWLLLGVPHGGAALVELDPPRDHERRRARCRGRAARPAKGRSASAACPSSPSAPGRRSTGPRSRASAACGRS